MKTIITTTALAALCAGAAWADGESIAVFTKNQTNPFFEAVRVGTEKAAEAMNASVIQYIPTQPDSIPEQLSQVEDVIVKQPDAIVFTPVDYEAMVPGVEQINDAGIPVVNITDRSHGGDFVSFVGADDYSLAKATAKRLFEAMGGKGNVVFLEGVKGTLTNTDRIRGFSDAMEEYPDITLVADQPANYQRLQALQVMENLMQSNPEIDGVAAANDAMAMGAIEALSGANRDAMIVGINGTKEAVEAIKAGKMLASGDYNGFLQGCIGTMIAIRAVRGEEAPAEVILKPVVVDDSNYEPYDSDVEDRDCPAWGEVAGLNLESAS